MRGIRIGVLYDLKDKLSGGLGKIRERMGKLNDLQKAAKLRAKEYFNSFTTGIKDAMPSLDAFKNRNIQLFEAISERVPFLSSFGQLLANPYALALAAVVALIAGITRLGGHMVDVTKDITANQEMVRMLFGQTGDELRGTTSQVMAISKVLKVETSELGAAANSLTKEYEDMGVKASDSLKAIKVGLIATNGKLDLEEMKEYSGQMRETGLAMEEFVALSVMGKKEGIFGDKAVDAVKEFKLKIKEMTPAAKEALAGIGLSGDAILKGLNDGSMTVMDTLRQVSKAMKGADVQARQTAIADLFGGPGEDAGERFLLKLADVKLSLAGMTEEFSAQQMHQLRQIELTEKLTAQQQRYAEIVQPMVNLWDELKLKAITLFSNVLAKGMEWFRDQWVKLEPVVMLIWDRLKTNLAPIVFLIGLAVTRIGDAFSLMFSVIRGVYNRVKMLFEFLGKAVDWIYEKLGGEGSLIDKMFDGIEKWRFRLKVFFEDIAELSQRTGKLIEAGLELDPSKMKAAFESLKGFAFRDADALYQKFAGDTKAIGGVPDSTNTPTPDQPDTRNASLAANTSQQRNVTVTIQNLNEGGINITTQHLKEAATDIETAFTEMLIRAVRNVEQTI